MKRGLIGLWCITIILATTSLFAGDCGDINNSGAVNIQDITYLINFLYKGGPVPNCNFGTVTDIDGNTYQTVKIGNQVWMAENLKVTHYRNGDAIPNVIENATWAGLTTGAYCEQNNDVNNIAVYGRLYNGYAVSDSRNIAPAGWHVPSDAEWQTLVDYLGGDAVAGDKLKEAGTTHWCSLNTGATNESGFTALPGGYRYVSGTYYGLGLCADFWSSTESDENTAWDRYLDCSFSRVDRANESKNLGSLIRCVMD
jgi:uncharacterized protein (TIGR02145 family)